MILETLRAKVILLVSVLILLGLSPVYTSAQESAPTNTITVGGKTLKLIGRGVREFLFVDIYKMAAYSESGNCTPSAIINKNETKAIRLSMVRKIPADRMNANLKKSLIEAMDNPNDQEMLAIIDSFLAFFKGDLVSGTFIEIIYKPGTGTVVKQNGTKLGTTPGKPFHELLWKSYFGKDTCCSSLKKDILEQCNS